MLRYYGTTDNLGGNMSGLLYDKPVSFISVESTEFKVVSGYTNKPENLGVLTVVDNQMTFNAGVTAMPTTIGLHILFSADGKQQCVVNVTDLSGLVTVSVDFILPEIVNDLFAPISTELAINGGHRYRCIAIKSESALSFQGGKLWLNTDISEGGIAFGFDPCGVNGNPTTSDGVISPAGVVFTAPLDEATGINIPTLNYADYVFLWVKRTTQAGASEGIFNFTIEESGTYV